MSLTFTAGRAADVFPLDLATSVVQALRTAFPTFPDDVDELYRSETIEAVGFPALQQRATELLGKNAAPQLTRGDAYQSVYLPSAENVITSVVVPRLADPLFVGSLDALLPELVAFASAASLPKDELALMHLAATYLEDDDKYDQDLDVQTFVQMLLTARQAKANGTALWVVAG